ncbi:hypothetical protein SEA_KNOCKER_76 [Mycobacterium phage Knocker]|nr:hypothetical protein SEA_KNOCKER_76 [Mycobacterium phage Knocker]
MARGTRARGSLKGGRSKVARRGHGGPRLSRSLGGFAARAGYGPGTPSVKRKDVYRALRREGASKEKAARIANATANGTINRKGGGRKGPLVGRKRR